MLQTHLDKNKYRQGYYKLIVSLDSCESWDQFCSWETMARYFFENIVFRISKLNRYTKFYFWHRREFKRWLGEVDIMLEDVKSRKEEFITKYQNDHTPDKSPVVIRGFHVDDHD